MKPGPKHTIRFLRHAESAANAGLSTSDPISIPLTDEGMRAATRASLEWPWTPPDLIVVSPYKRAQQTAEPFLARFSEAAVETGWPVHEFTYISPQRCVGTTFAERKPLVEDYWKQASPGYVDGPGAESFEGFAKRVGTSLEILCQHKQREILVVGHGIFMQAAAFFLSPTENPAAPDTMRRFHEYMRTKPIPNLGFWRYPDGDTGVLSGQ